MSHNDYGYRATRVSLTAGYVPAHGSSRQSEIVEIGPPTPF